MIMGKVHTSSLWSIPVGHVWRQCDDGSIKTGGKGTHLECSTMMMYAPCPLSFCYYNSMININAIYTILYWRYIIYCLIKCFSKIFRKIYDTSHTILLQFSFTKHHAKIKNIRFLKKVTSHYNQVKILPSRIMLI